MFYSQKISFENKDVHTIIDDSMIIWFHANQIAESIGYVRTKKVIMEKVSKYEKKQLSKLLSKSERSLLHQYIHPQTVYLNESGLYTLLLTSRKSSAKKFKKWLTTEVIPSLRQNGYYEMKQKNKTILSDLNKKISALKKSNETLQCDLKKEKYPKGAVVYAIEYIVKDIKQYRIGMSTDFNKRKKQYNTHLPNNAKVVILKKTNHACKFEYCLKSQLYDFRVKNRKDFYQCTLKQLKKAFLFCESSCNDVKSFNNVQKGGELLIEELLNKKTQYQDNVKRLKVQYIQTTLLD